MTTDIYAASSTVPRDDARDTERKDAIMCAKGVYYASMRAALRDATGVNYNADVVAAVDAYCAAIDAIYAIDDTADKNNGGYVSEGGRSIHRKTPDPRK
jgi:hypothetical protein